MRCLERFRTLWPRRAPPGASTREHAGARETPVRRCVVWQSFPVRIFVAGATGAIGKQLVPALIDAGHEVAGLTRKPQRAAWLESVGATAVIRDVYDPALAGDIVAFRPNVVVHQLTDLPSRAAFIPLRLRSLNTLRIQGTDTLIAAAKAARAERFVAQSLAFTPPSPARKAVEHLERATLGYPGVVIRYGLFHGPGTWYPDGTDKDPKVHVAEAARRTVGLLDAEPGVYEVVDSTYP